MGTVGRREVDIDLRKEHIQDLSSREAMAAFFASLGYDTSARTPQTPANLGIGAQSLLDQITHCELIADHEDLLQVYLFELNSLTVAATRHLARAFRNRARNFLLVLTADYDRLDFVLLERYVPEGAGRAAAISAKQANVRPRVLTVERLKPGRVEMRVLRRFTYTAGDPVGQYEKLLSAYGVAEWSEEHFNNRALFADYYLTERLPESDEWRQESPKDAYDALRELYDNAAARWANKAEGDLRSGLVEPALSALGFQPATVKAADSDEPKPDYMLRSSENGKVDVGVALAYTWDRNLDGKDYDRDEETPEENPGAHVVSLLHEDDAKWAIVTNGKHWRLYSPRTHAKATNYYEVDLEETLASPDPQESFRYFWFLFRRQAFDPRTITVDGEERSTTYLDQLIEGSEEYAKRLGDRLKDRIFDEIFRHLARGFVEYRRARQGADADLSQEALDEVFHGTLTLLYRLLFLLYAESRDLLPVRTTKEYYQSSLKRIKEEVAEAAGAVSDKIDQRLKRAYRTDSTDLYDQLTALFRIIDGGESRVNVPVYNGGLFISESDSDDKSPEAGNARFLLANKVSDRHLAAALDLLARDEDEKTFKPVFIDYKSLGVRQLGSIYEGLLEFRLRLAPEKMAICRGKRTEEVVPYRQAVRARRQILKEGRGQNAKERTYRKGDLYLENTRGERKATGSYYTPDYIVRYIVEHTVDPILEEKFDAVRPRLREAQKAHAAALKRNRDLQKAGMVTEDSGQVAGEFRDVVDALFDIKVLDPAMGSGHFLVEAVDFISDRMIAFLSGFPWNPVTVTLGQTRQAILRAVEEKGVTIDPARLTDVNLLKRHVLKRCVYGVDLNPMAVELAKVSLWLHCFTLGAPLSFLDHHLRCGNSLIGARVEEVREALQQVEKGNAVQMDLLGGQFAGLMLATEAMRHVGELSDVTPSQVARSRAEYQSASDALAPFKRILDVYLSQWFGNQREPALELLRSDAGETIVRDPKFVSRMRGVQKAVAERAFAEVASRRFFHWELEFPEVWYEQVRRKENPGFDAVVGNPPWGAELADVEKLALRVIYRTGRAQPDTYRFFMERGVEIARRDGFHSMIVPNSWLTIPGAEPLRRWLLSTCALTRVVQMKKDVFEGNINCVVYVAKKVPMVATCLVGIMGLADDDHRLNSETFGQRWEVRQSLWLSDAGCPINIAERPHERAVKAKIRSVADDLQAYFELTIGVQAYHNTLHTAREMADRIYHSDRPVTRDHLPQIDGDSIDRYEFRGFSGEYVKCGEWCYYCPPPCFLNGSRMLLRRVTPGGSLLTGAIVETPAAPYKSLLIVREGADEGYSLHYCVALVNGQLMAFSHRRAGVVASQDVFPQLAMTEAKQFPIRRIHFTTPAKERTALTEGLTSAYEASNYESALAQAERLLPKDSEGNFLAFRDGPNWKYDPETKTGKGECPEKSDVVHDFLAFLAEQMIEVNKEKQAEMKRFLGWLEEKLRISPDRQGREGIDALTGKTKLRGYLGDYQKGEEHLSFDEFLTILRRNRSRIGAGLSDPAFVERLRSEYESSLAKLLPIRTRLAKTDWLIDQVVYRLYGLTKEEIKIVERGGQ